MVLETPLKLEPTLHLLRNVQRRKLRARGEILRKFCEGSRTATACWMLGIVDFGENEEREEMENCKSLSWSSRVVCPLGRRLRWTFFYDF